MKTPSRSTPLSALSAAALALPAIAQLAQADAPADKTEIQYRYSQYEEDPTARSKVIAGSNERYTVENQQFMLVTPVADDMNLTVDVAYETMSGASAYGTTLDANNDHVLIMSGASIKDTRKDILAKLRNENETGAVTWIAGTSDEDDYSSDNIAIEIESSTPNRNTTYSGGLGYSKNDISPEQTPGVSRIKGAERDTWEGFAAITQVMSGTWQIQTGIFAALHDGYLTDAYKVRDSRPDQRQSLGIMVNSRYFVRSAGAALHTDYRYFQDDWGVEAHTLEVAWHQVLDDHWRVAPRMRYYSQSQADFYVDADSTLRTGYQSSDYRLSPFGAFSYGAGIIYSEPSYSLILSAEQYESDGNLALSSIDVESPALVNYTLLSVGVDYRF